MRIEKFNSYNRKINFGETKASKNLRLHPYSYPFEDMNKSQKLDVIYDMLQKQEILLKQVLKNQGNMHEFNYKSQLTLADENLYSSEKSEEISESYLGNKVSSYV